MATIIGSGSKVLVEITIDPTTERDAPEGETVSAGVVKVDAEKVGIPGPVAAGDVIIATDEHPFWVPDLREWVEAVDLAPGMWLQTSAGTWVQINAIQAWSQPATVHNLTVQGVHTYHVATGSLDVLNHNCDGSATVYYDPEQGAQGHAIIEINMSDGRSIVAEAMPQGLPGSRGDYSGLPNVGGEAFVEDMGPRTVSRELDLPDAESAWRAANDSIGVDQGPYGATNNCVSYCVRILRSGGLSKRDAIRPFLEMRREVR